MLLLGCARGRQWDKLYEHRSFEQLSTNSAQPHIIMSTSCHTWGRDELVNHERLGRAKQSHRTSQNPQRKVMTELIHIRDYLASTTSIYWAILYLFFVLYALYNSTCCFSHLFSPAFLVHFVALWVLCACHQVLRCLLATSAPLSFVYPSFTPGSVIATSFIGLRWELIPSTWWRSKICIPWTPSQDTDAAEKCFVSLQFDAGWPFLIIDMFNPIKTKRKKHSRDLIPSW